MVAGSLSGASVSGLHDPPSCRAYHASRAHPRYGYAASVVHDAGAFIRWLAENEIDLVLHGHMHLPSLVKHVIPLDYRQSNSWHEVTIAALGSSGVTINHRPNVPNSYGLVRFERTSVRITVRAISADHSISLSGARFIQYYCLIEPMPKKLLITDLDNTLYDWVTFFTSSFRGMIEELTKLLDVDEEILFAEFRAVHQKYGNSEQPFAVLELPSVLQKYPGLSQIRA